MIGLLTATPGGGKTCYVIDFIKAAEKEGRPIYQHGIKEFKVKSTKVYCRATSCTVCEDKPDSGEILYAEDWHEWAPSGAFLVFDEVQHIYRPRGPSQKPPESVMAFETHRHRGLDFWLISQNPTLFDANVRKMVSRHIHLRSTWATRQQFEWPEAVSDTSRTGSAVRSSYRLNKKNFSLYKSAEIHTKQKRKIPFALWVVIGAIALCGTAVYGTISSLQERIAPSELTEPTIGGVQVQRDAVRGPAPAGAESEFSRIQRMFDTNPTIPGILESAPAYVDLVEVKDYPRLAACIHNPERETCNCYTQQGTNYPAPLDRCYLELYGNGQFNPYGKAEDSRL